MEWYYSLAILLGAVFFGMAIGLPVAFSFLGANIIGIMLFMGGEAGLTTLTPEFLEALARFTNLPIILFLLMGEILFHTGVAYRAIDAIDRMITKVPGRMSIVAIMAGTVFSSLTGSTMANTAVLGSVLLPEMQKRGYKPSISMGPIMATGGIAMLVPPSALAVLLGSLAYIPVSSLLIAGILPGALMAILFLGYVIIRCTIDPTLAPSYEVEKLSGRDRWLPFFQYVLPLAVIFIAVVGSIFSGIASPTESAAVGCVAAVLVAAGYRALTIANLRKSLTETAKVAAMIMMIIAGSLTFSQLLSVSGATRGMVELVVELDLTPFTAVLFMLVILLILGALMDQVSMLLLTLPFFLPIAALHDVNIVWLGVLFLVTMEISLTTPPFGLILYVMRGVADKSTTMLQIYSAALPFIGLEIFVLAVLFLFPDLALWLPNMLE